MKNMKLTNLSLSVLVALGLVACGGSDDKGNAATDQNPPPGQTDTGNDNKGNDTANTGPKKDVNGLEVPVDPRRASPKMSVENNHVDVTKVNKQLYIDRQSRDAIAGYNGWFQGQPNNLTTGGNGDGNMGYVQPSANSGIGINTQDGLTNVISQTSWNGSFPGISNRLPGTGANKLNSGNAPDSVQGGLVYNPGATKDQDILRNSIYNYLEEQSKQNSLNANGGIHANPAFSYAKGGDGNYYRVIPSNGQFWDTLTGTSTFQVVPNLADNNYGNAHQGGTLIPMSEIVFIPNALGLTRDTNKVANQAHKPGAGEFATANAQAGVDRKIAGVNILNPTLLPFFDLNRGNVQYKTFELAGVEYDLVRDFNTNNIPLDLSKVDVKKEIQTKGIKLNYDIINDQATGTLNDDEVVSRTTEVGAMKLYNLPYSRSSLTINQQAVADANHVNSAPNNLFNLAGGVNGTGTDGHYGAFQVVGFQTNSLPRDGRADYVGKSYGVNSEGDLHLVADFAINRAGIHGSVDNRKTVDGKRSLASLTLQQIDLSNNNYEHTASAGMQTTSRAPDGAVAVGGRNVGYWAVALYGPNAEEVGGIIDLDGTNYQANGAPTVDGLTPQVFDNATGVWVNNSAYNNGKNVEVFSGQRGRIIDDSLNPGVGSAK